MPGVARRLEFARATEDEGALNMLNARLMVGFRDWDLDVNFLDRGRGLGLTRLETHLRGCKQTPAQLKTCVLLEGFSPSDRLLQENFH